MRHRLTIAAAIAVALSAASPALAQFTGNTPIAVGAIGANPTATIGTAAVNGSATTYMRSDAAPAIPQASSSTFGAVKVDGTTITATAGVISSVPGGLTTAGCGLASSSGTVSASGRTAHGNSDFSIGATVNYAALNAALTAARTWTLPAASALTAGCTIKIADEAGGITATNTLNVVPAGSDTLNGGVGYLLYAPYMAVYAQTDGVSAWTVSAGMNLPPLTSGGIWYGNATPLPKNLPKGTDGQVLTLASGLPSWATNPAAGCASGTANVLQKSTGTACANSSITDSGTLITTTEPFKVTGGDFTQVQDNATSVYGALITGTANIISLTMQPSTGTGSPMNFTEISYTQPTLDAKYYADGVQGTPTHVLSGEQMYYLQVQGYRGDGFYEAGSIMFTATQDWSAGNVGTKMEFSLGTYGATSPRLTIAPSSVSVLGSGVVFGIPQATWVNNQTCTVGQISVDANYVYVCTASNTAKRAALSAF